MLRRHFRCKSVSFLDGFQLPYTWRMYILMFVTPIVGVVTFIWHGRIFDFGFFQINFGIRSNQTVFEPTEDIHGYLAYAIFALAGIHTLAALWHQFILRDGVLARMWPGRAAQAERTKVLRSSEIMLNETIEAEPHDQRASAFLRLVQAHFGESPHVFLVRRRVELAAQCMLTTDACLSDIALQCGFTDQAHFSKHFRQATGKPPQPGEVRTGRTMISTGHHPRNTSRERRGLPVKM